MADETVAEVIAHVKKQTNDLFDTYFVPRMERHLDLKMQQWLESIVEKKIEERFAFAIELLRSMKQRDVEESRVQRTPS